MTKSDPATALLRILCSAVVALAADEASDQQGIDMAYAYMLAMANATPRNSIFSAAVNAVLSALVVLIEGSDGTPESKAFARRLDARIAKAKGSFGPTTLENEIDNNRI